MPESPPGLQLSQLKNAVYQHLGSTRSYTKRPDGRKAAALLTHANCPEDLPFLSKKWPLHPSLSIKPYKPPCSCPLGDSAHHAEGSRPAHTRSLTARKTPAWHISSKHLPRKRAQQLFYRPAWPMHADLRPAASPRPRSIPEASQETQSHREKPSQAAVAPAQRGTGGRHLSHAICATISPLWWL